MDGHLCPWAPHQAQTPAGTPCPIPRSSWAQPSAVSLSWPIPITKQGPLGHRHDKRGSDPEGATELVPHSNVHPHMTCVQ